MLAAVTLLVVACRAAPPVPPETAESAPLTVRTCILGLQGNRDCAAAARELARALEAAYSPSANDCEDAFRALIEYAHTQPSPQLLRVCCAVLMESRTVRPPLCRKAPPPAPPKPPLP